MVTLVFLIKITYEWQCKYMYVWTALLVWSDKAFGSCIPLPPELHWWGHSRAVPHLMLIRLALADYLVLIRLSTTPTGGVVAFGWRYSSLQWRERERTAAWTDHFSCKPPSNGCWLLAELSYGHEVTATIPTSPADNNNNSSSSSGSSSSSSSSSKLVVLLRIAHIQQHGAYTAWLSIH